MPFSEYDMENLDHLIRGEGTWFHAHLARLIVKADVENLELLRLGFPTEVAAIEAWRAR